MQMTSKEIIELLCELVDLKELTNRGMIIKDVLEYQKQIERDLEALNILKPRISLKDSALKNAYFVVGENGLPELQQDLKDVDVAFVEASGFVFKNSAKYKILKEWLENE